MPERACKAGALYGIDGKVGIVERPQHGESACLVSRRSGLSLMEPRVRATENIDCFPQLPVGLLPVAQISEERR